MTVSIFWIWWQNREAKMKRLSHPLSTQLTWWWNFTLCSPIVHLNHRPIHSSFIEKLIVHECHPAPASPIENLLTCSYLDKQILLRAAQWVKTCLHSFVTCDWACWCSTHQIFASEDTRRLLSFYGTGFMELVVGNLRALLLCLIRLK